MRIGFDLHGTDLAPRAELEALDLIRLEPIEGCEIVPIGKVGLESEIKGRGFPFIIAEDVVGMHEIPSVAVRRKRQSTMAIGMQLLKEKKLDAFISAGNTGALFGFARLILGKIEGVSRPGIGVPFPSEKGYCLLIDVGANLNASSVDLYQYGIMGSIFARTVMGIKRPKVGLLNIGEEYTKGNESMRRTYSLLHKSSLNFVGNIEGGDLMKGYCDVVVTNGFVGNILLKFAEGFAATVGNLFQKAIESAVRRKVGAVFIRSALSEVKGRLNYEEYGGGILLGLPQTVVLAHGRSSAAALRSAVKMAEQCAKSDLSGLIYGAFQENDGG
ncbi:MAG TPA: phosphate acyltransferase PlsX [bacterium (Candidatus Stahlbacteria)]|nr:phosphate acyltransferase PlsX [Candidatus Stahlbacteria bacterium]